MGRAPPGTYTCEYSDERDTPDAVKENEAEEVGLRATPRRQISPREAYFLHAVFLTNIVFSS